MFKHSLASMVANFLTGGVLTGATTRKVSPKVHVVAQARSLTRSRIPGPAGKPGNKLARLAARRRVGLSTIR